MTCLGTGAYSVRFVRRLPGRLPSTLGEAEVLDLSWNRLISATTAGSVTLPIRPNRDVLARLAPWRDEFEIWRNERLQWAGPMTDDLAIEGDNAVVTGQDLSAWWTVRAILVDLAFRGVDLSEIFAALVEVSQVVEETGIEVAPAASGIVGDRTYAGLDARYLADELAELAKTGCDWTMTARTLWIGGQEIAPGRRLASPLLETAFASTPRVRLSGAEMATETIVRGSAVLGRAGGPDADGVLIQRVRDASSIEDQGSADAAAETWLDRVRTALLYVDGDASLSARAPVAMEELVPGLMVRVELDGSGVLPVAADLRLEKVAVAVQAGDETTTVGLQPLGTTEET